MSFRGERLLCCPGLRYRNSAPKRLWSKNCTWNKLENLVQEGSKWCSFGYKNSKLLQIVSICGELWSSGSVWSLEGLIVVTLTDVSITWAEVVIIFCSGCRNVALCDHKQSFSGLHWPRRSYFTCLWCDSWVQTPLNSISVSVKSRLRTRCKMQTDRG